MKKQFSILVSFVPSFIFILALFTAVEIIQATGTTILVTTTQDVLNPNDGQCSLREAITAANINLPSGNAPGECASGINEDIIQIPTGIYTLSIPGNQEDNNLTGDLDIRSAMTLVGDSQANTIIDGAKLDRVLDVSGTFTTAIQHLTLQNGFTTVPLYGSGGGLINSTATLQLIDTRVYSNTATRGSGLYNWHGHVTIQASSIDTNGLSQEWGGGIVNYGVLEVIDSAIKNNRATNGGGLVNSQSTYGIGTVFLTRTLIVGNSVGSSGGGLDNAGGRVSIYMSSILSNTASTTTGGGGIYNHSSAFGTSGVLTITSSTIQNNIGIGIYNTRGPVGIENTTISGNAADNFGGGGLTNLASSANLTVTLRNVTVANNIANGGAGGIAMLSGVIKMSNSLVAGNTNAGGPSDCSGTLTSEGYNLVQSIMTCTVTGTLVGNIIGSDPLLGPLQDNGGATLTHALLAGSPAIDAGDPAGCQGLQTTMLFADQRGYPRMGDGNGDGIARCDMGAYELWLSNPFLYLPLLRR